MSPRATGSEGRPGMPSDEVRAELDSWSPAAARPGFRAELRARFLADQGALVGESSTSPELGEEGLAARLAAYEPPAARPEFRARLRRDFLGAGRASRRAPTESGAGRLLSLRSVATLLAAAAALLLFLWAPWRSGATVGGSSVILNGEPVSYEERERLESSIERGDCSLSVGDEDLRVLTLDDGVFLEFPPGTDLRVLPRAPGERGLLELEVKTGGVRVSTREDFEGRILVHTPDAVISLAGPAIGIDVFPEGTCLCILDGAAEMSGKGQSPNSRRVSVGEMAFVERGESDFAVQGDLHHQRELEAFAETSDRYLF